MINRISKTANMGSVGIDRSTGMPGNKSEIRIEKGVKHTVVNNNNSIFMIANHTMIIAKGINIPTYNSL